MSSRFLPRIQKLGVQYIWHLAFGTIQLGGSGDILPEKILKKWSPLDAIWALLGEENVTSNLRKIGMFPTHFALKMQSHAYLRKRTPTIDSELIKRQNICHSSNICHLNFEIYFLEGEIISRRPNTFQAVQNLDSLNAGVLTTPRRPLAISPMSSGFD